MNFDVEEPQGVWFDFGTDGARVQLKALSADEWRKIMKQTVKRTPFVWMPEDEKSPRPPQVLTHEVIDEDLRFHLINDATIVAWERFSDRNGHEIPCTAEWKTRLMLLKDASFRDFVTEKVKLLGEIGEARAGEAEKN